MKKIFNLILAALVIIGAAACTKNEEVVNEPQVESLSFYAEVVNGDTRAYIDDADGDKVWNTIWEEGDQVSVRGAGKTYTFTYDGAKFTCTEEGVESIIGETVTISPTVYHFADAKAGKRGWSFNTAILTFTEGMKVQFEANTSYFRYTYNGDKPITFTVEDGYTGQAGTNFVVQGSNSYSVAYNESITFDGGTGENFIAFYFGTNKYSKGAKLSYSIDGVKCKETTIDLYVGKVYNLGTLADPVATAYSVPGSHNGWTPGATPMYKSGELCVAYGVTFTAAGTFKVLGNDKWYGADIVEGQWVKASTDGADMSVPAGVYDIYFSEARTMVCVVAAGATAPELPSITWALAGDFNSWGDLIMASTATANLFVAKGVELAAGSEFKVKDSTTWDTSFGRGVTYLAANSYMTVIQGGNDNNISIAQSGTYDVYFEYLGQNSRLYLMEANADYATAKEQTADGALVPDQPQGETPGLASAWSVSGTHNGWGDTPMVTTTVKNLYVAKSVKLDAYASFKVRKDKAWTEGYGGGIVYMNPNGYIEVYQGGSDISNTAAGTFDIYFDYTHKYLYLVTAGGDYTKVSKQTAEGKEPENEEVEVTENKLYLKPNSNWTQASARFAAYFFGSGDEKWVSMTDTDKDGIYEVNIPEGYDYGCNVIFCRMNPGTTANNWNNKWNQTSDLKAPTDGKNLYTVKAGTWDKGGGTWSVK